jgi:hypothetical protein
MTSGSHEPVTEADGTVRVTAIMASREFAQISYRPMKATLVPFFTTKKN